MTVEELAQYLTDELHQQLRAIRGAQAAACRAAGVGKNYWVYSKNRGSIDLRPFLYALRELGLSPAEFFSDTMRKSQQTQQTQQAEESGK